MPCQPQYDRWIPLSSGRTTPPADPRRSRPLLLRQGTRQAWAPLPSLGSLPQVTGKALFPVALASAMRERGINEVQLSERWLSRLASRKSSCRSSLRAADTKRVRIGSGKVVPDHAWLPLKIGHFEPAIATINGRFRPPPPTFAAADFQAGSVLVSGSLGRQESANRRPCRPTDRPDD